MGTDDPSAPPAAAYPRWILLENYWDCDDQRLISDARTVAHARTSKGRPISVSFVLAAPPALSGLLLHSHDLPEGVNIRSKVVAAHGDSVLVNIRTRSDGWNDDDVFAYDYFIYCAGDAAAEPCRPPSLSMIPPVYHAQQEEGEPKEVRSLHHDVTALLRRCQDDVLVAELHSIKNREASSGPLQAELSLLRSSSDWHWETKRLPVIHDEGKRQELSLWCTDSVVPVGDRFLFWVDYFRGIIYSDPWDETPKLHYVSLPVEPDTRRGCLDRVGPSYRSVCATDGGQAVRFVEIFPRCCCGSPCETACAVSRYAFTITTWTLRMEDMTTWDKLGVIDCDELWSIPGYKGMVQGIKPDYPIVSLDDPDILCIRVHKNKYHTGVHGDLGKRLIEIDTRRMELRSIRYFDHEYDFWSHFVVSTVSQFFDASSRSHAPTRQKESDQEAPVRPSKLTLPRVASSEEMLVTLQEIPDLAPDIMLKVYDIFVSDKSQFKFSSLMALQMDMRKDYCHLIGKLSYLDG